MSTLYKKPLIHILNQGVKILHYRDKITSLADKAYFTAIEGDNIPSSGVLSSYATRLRVETQEQ